MTAIEIAYAKYCRKQFALPNAVEVGSLEDRIGVELPEHYREYLLQWNGGYFKEPCIMPPKEGADPECPSSSLVKMFGIGTPLDDAGNYGAEVGRDGDISLWDNNDPVIMLPIGYTVMGAFIILWTGEDYFGEVGLRTFDDTFWLADSMEEFFALFQDECETVW